MHQIQSIPNNNTEFSFEKADPKTLENILKDLENQEKELLRESTQKTEKKYWDNLKKYDQTSKSLFNFNVQNVNSNPPIGNQPNLIAEPYWYNNGNGFLPGGITTFGHGFDYSSLMRSQVQFKKMNQHTFHEMNNFYPSQFGQPSFVNYPPFDQLNGFDIHQKYPNNIPMQIFSQNKKTSPMIQKSKSAYVIKPNVENIIANKNFNPSKNMFLKEVTNKTLYSTPKMISKNIKVQFNPKNAQKFDETSLRVSVNKVVQPKLEEKAGNDKKAFNKINNTFNERYYLPENNKTTDFSIQQKYLRQNLQGRNEDPLEKGCLRSKSLHDTKIKSINSPNIKIATKQPENLSRTLDIPLSETLNTNLSRTIEIPVKTHQHFKIPVKLNAKKVASEITIQDKKSPTLDENKKNLQKPAALDTTMNRSNQNSFYKDLKLAEVNTFKSTIEYHEDENAKNSAKTNTEINKSSNEIPQTNTHNQNAFDITNDELEEIFSEKIRIIPQKHENLNKIMINKQQIESSKSNKTQMETIPQKDKDTNSIISRQSNFSAFKAPSLQTNLIKPNSIEKFSNVKNANQVENSILNDILKNNTERKSLEKDFQSNQNLNKFSNIKSCANFGQLKKNSNLDLKNKLREQSCAYLSSLVQRRDSCEKTPMPRKQIFSITDLKERDDKEKIKLTRNDNAFISVDLPLNLNDHYELEAEKEMRLKEICDYLREELDFKKSDGSLSSGYDSPSSSNSITRENLLESNKAIKTNPFSKNNFDNELAPTEEAFGYLIVDLNQFENADNKQVNSNRKLWVKDIPIFLHENSSKSVIKICS
jgi:hypothetical protein